MLQERIYRLRRERGLSQEELADQLGVSRQAVQKWESGVSQPTLEKLTALARYFDVTLDWLVTGRESAPGPGSDWEGEATVVRHSHTGPVPWGGHYEYKSARTLLGLPLVHVNVGWGWDGRLRRARGIVAVGNAAVGLVSVGGFSLGVLSVGGITTGLLALGGLSLGLLAAGGVAAGLVALGGVALGKVLALGGVAVGNYAIGGAALGRSLAIGGAAFGDVAVGETAEGVRRFLTDGTSDPAAIGAAVREACHGLPEWLTGFLVNLARSV